MAKKEYTLEQASVNTLRVLGCEAISHATSGHSGIVLGSAPAMYAIYDNMKFDPDNGAWFNRDRFVLSAGHGSALHYTTLKCFGFGGIDLKTLRRLGSPLTGHPEHNEKIGVDCSTGPLGQGIAMAVGIALAEQKLSAEYNRDGHEIIDHYTYCLCGDGCLQEGISYEACSLAGLWKLNKLILLYDSNNVTLDGDKNRADCEDVVARFKAMKWNVLDCLAGNDELAVSSCIAQAKASQDAPTIIIVNTEIGFGSKVAGSNKAHSLVMAMEEIADLREEWDLESEHFEMDSDVAEHFENIKKSKCVEVEKWKIALEKYKIRYPELYGKLSEFIEKPKRNYECVAEGKTMQGREAGAIALGQIAKKNPRLIGGGADVTSTTKAFVEGRDIPFGVREHAMAGICNGLALHGYTPFCSTFLAFSDYMKPAIRLTAMMNLPVTYIFSHDGIGSAPDGPTHQGNENITALRLIPNMDVYRPAHDVEISAVYEYVFENQKPATIILSRGDLNGNFLKERKNVKNPVAVLLASGSEVQLCLQVQKKLSQSDIFVNVISVPCLEKFMQKGKKESAFSLDKKIPVFALEMGSGMPWWAMFGKFCLHGDVIAFDRFGSSGTDSEVKNELGFTVDKISKRVTLYLFP